MKKMDDSDLNQVSGGYTKADGGNWFFNSDKIYTTCDKCSATKTLKLSKKNKGKWEIMGAYSYQSAEINWTCEKCGAQNHTTLHRSSGLFGFGSGTWEGCSEIKG